MGFCEKKNNKTGFLSLLLPCFLKNFVSTTSILSSYGIKLGSSIDSPKVPGHLISFLFVLLRHQFVRVKLLTGLT